MTTLDARTMTALNAIATEEEISALLKVLDAIARGRVEMWMLELIADIVGRLNWELAKNEAQH